MRDDHHDPFPHLEPRRNGERERVRDGDCERVRERVRDGDCDCCRRWCVHARRPGPLTGGSWGAAAGWRGAEVSVENRGSAACTLPAGPSVAILDAGGPAIIESPPPTDEPGPTLEPGGVTTFAILFSNWCDEGTALPLRVVLRSGSPASRSRDST